MEVYEAASNPEYFSEVGDRISAFARGGRAHFLLFDPGAGREYLHYLSGEKDDFSKEYNEIYLPRDFRVPRVVALPVARFTDERAYVAPEEARTSDIHQDLLARYRIHNIYGANLRTGSALGWFGLSVRERGTEFDHVTMRALSGLVLHLQRAYATLLANSDLMLDRSLMAAALDDAKSAILIVDGGRVVLANAMMQDLLSRGFFRLLGARLGCRDRHEGRKLSALQDDRLLLPREPTVIRDGRSGESFAVTCRRLFPQIGSDGAISGREQIVTVTPIFGNDEPDVRAIEAFCREHFLTERERGVIAVVLTGGSLSRHAAGRGVTVDTVRKQLKSAMARLEAASQKDLVRLFERFRMAR